MRIEFLPLLLLVASLSPQGAAAQSRAAPQRDAIGDLLDPHHVAAPGDEDEPDTAGQVRTAPEAEPALPPAAQSYKPGPRPHLTAPVRIEETGKTADAPPSLAAMAYDSRIRSSFASAESFQGPLDGGWTLSEPLGGDHYALQIVDRRDRLEAVWRDVRRTGAINASGMVEDIRRTDDGVTLRFTDSTAQTYVVNLRQAANGRWAGRMVHGEEASAVTLRRTGP